MQLVPTIPSTIAENSFHECIVGGSPVRGKLRKTTLRYDLRPVCRPSQKGELVDSASTCGSM